MRDTRQQTENVLTANTLGLENNLQSNLTSPQVSLDQPAWRGGFSLVRIKEGRPMAGQWPWKVESLAAWPCLPASGLVAGPFSPLGLVPRTSHPLRLGLRIRESCTRATDCLPALQSHYAAAVTSSPGDRTFSHPWSFAPPSTGWTRPAGGCTWGTLPALVTRG